LTTSWYNAGYSPVVTGKTTTDIGHYTQ